MSVHSFTIELEPLDGPATVISLEGRARDIRSDPTRLLALGDTVAPGAQVILDAGTRLVLRRPDGTDADYSAPPEAGREIAFQPRQRPESAELYDAQVQGFMNLHQQGKQFGFDADAMLNAMPMAALAEDATAALLGIAERCGPPPLNAAQASALGVVPLGDIQGAMLVAAERWTVERALAVLAALKRGISTVTVTAAQLAVLRRSVYPDAG